MVFQQAPAIGEFLSAVTGDEDTFFTSEEQEITDRVNESVGTRRIILFLLGAIQSAFLEVPAFLLSVTNADLTSSVIDICRLVYTLTSMLVSFHSISYLLVRKEALRQLRQMLWLRWFTLAFELTLFAFQGTDFTFFVYLGIGNLIFSLVTLVLGYSAAVTISSLIGERDTYGYAMFLKANRYAKDRLTVSDLAAQVTSAFSFSGEPEGELNNSSSQKKPGIRALISSMFSSKKSSSNRPTPMGGDGEGKEEGLGEEALLSTSEVADFCKPGYSGPNSWKRWFVAHRIRDVIGSVERQFHLNVKRTLMVVILFTFCNITYEFLKIFSQQQPLLSDSSNAVYNKKVEHFPTRSHDSWKVHLVVVDGLRDDLTEPGSSEFGDYISSPSFAPYSLKFKARAQLPTFSVPNWMSILTGTTPEIHGVTGNLGIPETSFDHIFRQAERYGLHTGMTGTPWWKTLVFSTLPELDGDGTVDASYVPEDQVGAYEWDTSNPADEERLRVALKAAVRSTISYPFGPSGVPNLYDFFLTHFSDVDKQGHEYGVDEQWNTRDTYFGAIKNKTKAIRQIVDAIDTNTVLIITSDHGHVKRGGHGGVSSVLRDVPLIFFTKGNLLNTTTYTPSVFTSAEEPRSSADGNHQNLDISGTICALLGIPSPRQSLGIFVEEALIALLPNSSVLSQHFRDIYTSKQSATQEFAEFVASTSALFTDYTTDPEVTGTAQPSLAAGTATDREYGDAFRKLIPIQSSMRDQLSVFNLVINLLGSLILWGFYYLMLASLFGRQGGTRMWGFGDDEGNSDDGVVANLKSLNTKAHIIAALTVIFYFIFCFVGFAVGYFFVIGYNVWDSTLTHTTSSATPYLGITVTIPIIVFIVLNKLYLMIHIDWNSSVISGDRAAGKEMTCRRFLSWLVAIARDLVTFFTATSKYKTHSWPAVYLYSKYMCMWTLILSGILLFLAFPFTTAVPVVLSTPFVSDLNLEYRFRIMTLWIIITPLQVGTLLMLHLEPKKSDSKNLVAFDLLFTQCYLASDICGSRNKTFKYGTQKELIEAAIALLQDPEMSVAPEDLAEASFFNKDQKGVGRRNTREMFSERSEATPTGNDDDAGGPIGRISSAVSGVAGKAKNLVSSSRPARTQGNDSGVMMVESVSTPTDGK